MTFDRCLPTSISAPAIRRLALALMLLTAASFARAQSSRFPGPPPRDEPTASSPVDAPEAEEPTGFMRALSAVCWYLPNRIADFTDIPRLYLTLGDGMGASVRATKYCNFTWFQDDAYGIGWNGKPRKPPFFGELVEERYAGFFAAQAGELDRDPTEVGLTLHFIAIGANAAVSLGEAVDFVAGVIGVDLANDDHGPFMDDRTE